MLSLIIHYRYRDDLGHAIANFARVVPDGLLVFFPAYSLLTACLDHWKASTGENCFAARPTAATEDWVWLKSADGRHHTPDSYTQTA